LIFIL
jgi:aarF domain-containing kinase